MASPKCQLNLLEVLPLYTSFKCLSKKIQKFQLVMNKPNQNYERNECEKGTLNLEQNEFSKGFFFFNVFDLMQLRSLAINISFFKSQISISTYAESYNQIQLTNDEKVIKYVQLNQTRKIIEKKN